MTRSNLRNLQFLILALALSGCVVHTQPGSRQVPPPQREREVVGVVPGPQYEDPRLAQCRAANYRAHSEAMQIYHRAQAAGNISPLEAQQFAAAEQRLRQHASLLARDGTTLNECQSIGRDIANEHALIGRMAASRPGYSPYRGDPALMQCRADAQRTHAETLQLYYRARASGAISPHEAQQFSAAEQRLTRHAQTLARDGLTLRECEFLQREIAGERVQVERMASARRPVPTPAPAPAPAPQKPDIAAQRPDSAQLAQCSSANRKARAETLDLYARARAAGRVKQTEAQAFAKMEQRLDERSRMLARDGMTLQECEVLARSIAEQRSLVERMAAGR
jgi:hypothetical protein